MGRLAQWLLDFLFPRRCIFCHKLSPPEQGDLCPQCHAALPWLRDGKGQRVEFVERCLAPLRYEGTVRDSIHRYKFSNCPGYATQYGQMMAQCVTHCLSDAFDVIAWVPLSPRSLRRRGYDQARLLAQAVGLSLGLTLQPLLVKRRSTRTQSTLRDSALRRANVRGAYTIAPGAQVTGLRVLLVDDVVTSGATLSECAGVLRMGGAALVSAITLAQAGK